MAPNLLIYVLVFTVGLLAAAVAETITLERLRPHHTKLLPKPPFQPRFNPPIGASTASNTNGDLELLDVVLLASVDGKLHALNRTTGRMLWSMSSSASSNAVPSMLGPLVRTTHVESDPELTDDESANQDLYIIEPQSGDIYVLSSPFSPLNRLSLSMSQLVDLSPFTFTGDESRQEFVGKKETSLLLIDLETGKVKATLSSECPWDPSEDLHGSVSEPDTDDLDDTDGTIPPVEKAKRMEVFIGRTDYHISIRTSRPDSSKLPIQNLSFSTYGPNNQDISLQSTYHRTPDDTYIQPLPNGDVIPLKAQVSSDTKQDSHLPWAYSFGSPIVAVFDVLKSPGRHQPFVLLQPRPRLQDVLPGSIDHLNIDSAYVGLIEETGSLFAMGPDNFPLVIFGDASSDHDARLIDPPPQSNDNETSEDPDSNTSGLPPVCRNGSPHRKCLTGVRPLGEDSRSRISRLLHGSPSVGLPPERDLQGFTSFEDGHTLSSASGWGNGSIFRPWILGHGSESVLGRNIPLASPRSLSVALAFILSLIITSVWFTARRIKARWYTPNVTVGIVNGDASSPSKQPPNFLPLEATVQEEQLATPFNHPPPSLILPPDASTPLSPKVHENGFVDAVEDGEDSDKDVDAGAVLGRRKGRRGKRGKKKKGLILGEDGEVEKEQEKPPNSVLEEPAVVEPDRPPAIDSPSIPHTATTRPSLIVSETILGFGSHGTVVFQGSLQGRAVAVKRLLQDFVTLASREVSVLQESDDHPNVIRYYYQEAHANFLYIALELCPASLADVIESPDQFRDIAVAFDPKRAVRQITSGLRHLHALKIVHRDIKPQNILISSAKQGAGSAAGHRMLISDFGLCKKLDVDQTSFLPTAHGALAAGTVGWRAPEILRGEVKLDESMSDDQSQSSQGGVGTPSSSGKPTRLTKSVDIFALGCLFYYTLTNGSHPFGDRFEREVNILKNIKSLDGLQSFGEEGSEATDLIEAMLSTEAHERLDTTTCLLHPYFWDPGRRLTFLQDASDRFEIMCRDPRDPNLVALETDAVSIVGNDWHTRLDKIFIENLGKFRKYDGKSVQDLLRALRNKKHHYQDLPDNVKRHLGPMPEGFLSYFTRRFPRLFLHVHSVIAGSSLRQESMFRSYFELSDS